MAAVLKTVIGASRSGVQIPPPPPLWLGNLSNRDSLWVMPIGRREFLRSASLVTIVVATGLCGEFLSISSRKVVLSTTRIEQLGMSVRLTNALKANRITTVGQLASTSQDDLLSIRSVGRFCVGEIREKLVENGFLSRASAALRYPDGLLLRDRPWVKRPA